MIMPHAKHPLPQLFVLALFWIAVLLAAFAPRPAAAEGFADKLVEKGKLTIGTTGASPPSTMYDIDGKLVGLDIDLAEKIARDLDLEVEFVVLDWAAMLAGVQAGRFDMVASSVARTPARVESADFFISQAYVANGVGGAVHRDNEIVKSWADACGGSVGIVKGAAQINTVKEKFGEACFTSITEYPGWTELLLDLQNKRIDLVVGNYITPAYLIKSTSRPISLLDEALAINGNALVIQRGNPELAQEVDKLLEKYQDDGSLAEITEKWIGTPLDLKLIAQ